MPPRRPAVEWSRGAPPGARVDVLPLEIHSAERRSRGAVAWRAGGGRPPGRGGVGARGRRDPGRGLGGQRRRAPRGSRPPRRGRRAPGVDPLLLSSRAARCTAPARGVPRVERPTRCSRCRPTRPARWAPRSRPSRPGARTGLRVVVARPFPHTGPGQTARLRRAGLRGATARRAAGGRAHRADRQPRAGARSARRARRGRGLPGCC